MKRGKGKNGGSMDFAGDSVLLINKGLLQLFSGCC